MNTNELVEILLNKCNKLKRQHEGSFKLRGINFTRSNLETVIVWLEEGCAFELGQEEAWLVAALAN